MSEPKVLIFDIETAPIEAYVWSNWQTNVIATKEDWYLLSVQHNWMHDSPNKIHFERKAAARRNDKALTKHVWNLLDECDVAVAHNGDQFDVKKVNSRFLKHGLGLPSSFIQIDTKKEAKRHLNLASYSLAEIGRYYDLGSKTPHTGFELWLGCMNNDSKSWALMKKYGNQDVRLLRKVYEHLYPVINYPGRAGNRFNAQQWSGNGTCTQCSSKDVVINKEYRTKAGWKMTVRCRNCQSYSTFKRSNTDVDTGEWR